METPWSVALTHAGVLCALGVALEVAFTAVAEFRASGDRRLMGATTLWMVPIYALVYPALRLIYPVVVSSPLLVRGGVYVACIYAVEYASGWALRRTLGACPWEAGYRKARWHYHGLIRLDYAPAWLAAGLLFEWTYRVLQGLE